MSSSITKTLSRTTKVIIIIACVLAVGSWVFYFYLRAKSVVQLEQKLATTIDKRSDRINAYIANQITHGAKIASQSEIQEAIVKLSSLSPEEIKSSAQDLSKKLTLFLEEYSTEESFRNSLLITKDGRVVYSDYAPEYVGKNLSEGELKSSSLGESYIRSLMSLTADVSSFSYDPVLDRIALFITIPIFKDNMLLGLLSQEVSTAKIYSIIQDYIGLGKTGEVLLGKKVPQGILYISKSRDDFVKPFKNFIYYNKLHDVVIALPMVLGATGSKGTGVEPDQSGEPTVAAWQYVPIANWGIVAKVDLREVYDSLWYMYVISILLTLFLVIVMIIAAYHSSLIKHSLALFLVWTRNPRPLRTIKILTFMASLILLFGIAYIFMVESKKEMIAEQESSIQKLRDTQEALTHILKEHERIGQALAYDLYGAHLSKQDLLERMQRDLQENPALYGVTIAFEPYAYSAERRLYAPYMHRKGEELETEYLDESFDYTKEALGAQGRESQSWAWYAQAIAKKDIVWFDPYLDSLSNVRVLGLSIPFFDPADEKRQKPIGVINLLFDITSIQKLIAQLDVNTQGLVYLVAHSGAFIYYPLRDYVSQEKTIYDLAREQSNGELITIVENALKGKEGADSYQDFATGEKVFTFFEAEPITKWALGIVMPASDVKLPTIVLRHYYMVIVFTLIVVFFCLLWLLGGLFLSTSQQYSHIMTIVLILGIGAFFYIIRSTQVFVAEDQEVISSPIKLTQFEYRLDSFANEVNEDISIKIPMGIYIYSADLTSATTLSISGYIWQKFNKDIPKEWIIDPQLPQAIEEVKMRKIYESQEGDYLVVGWFFNTRLTQRFDYSKYPLDLLTVRIDLEYADLSKNVTLVPALADYIDIKPESLPGVGVYQGLVFPAFDKQRAFFTLLTETEDTNMGMPKAYGGITKHVYMSYNISLIRYLLYDVIVLLLPLLIVFFSLYTIFMIGERDKTFTPLTALSAYTGLVFTAIILHGAFRSRIEINQLLYIEYVFFMLYITFVLLVMHSLLKMNKKGMSSYVGKAYDLFRVFFWPIQLIVFMIITMIVFYTR